MNLRYISFLKIMIISGFTAMSVTGRGQTTTAPVKALTVGDSVPDLVFRTMINYRTPSARLSDFKGKAVILDFWATYCVPCIASFPKLEKLQREFKDDLSIILLSNYDEKGIRSFYRTKSDLSLPTVYYDHKKEVFDRMFPHREIPHYVWIDKKGRVYAITSSLELNEKSLRAFLEGKASSLSLKDDSMKWGNHSGTVLDSIVFEGKANKMNMNPDIIFQSVLRRYDPRLTAMSSEGVGKDSGRHLTLQNCPVVHLMFNACGYRSSLDQWRFYLDLKDTTAHPSLAGSDAAMEEWYRSHCFTYRIVLEHPDSVFLHEVMQRDLQHAFGIRVYRRKITLPCLVLQRTGGNISALKPSRTDTSSLNRSIYNITLKNRPVKDLAEVIYRYHVGKEFTARNQYRIPVLDETGISSPVDLDIRNINITDIKALNGELNRFGLQLKKEDREMDMIVLSDKQG